MKKAFITGITGTVAPYLKEELIQDGYQVLDKHFRINEDSDLLYLNDYLIENKPDIIFHLGLGPLSFTENLVTYCKENEKDFVYISTVSVFEDNLGGPYYVDTKVTVKNDYGKYKYENELLVKRIKPDSYIIRIGWQISDKGDSESNNMLNFIKNNLNDKNEITVSDQFYPSTSFLDQTVKGIKSVLNNEPGLYFVNSNHDKSLYEIVMMLKKKFNLDIEVKKDSSFSRNDIMIDSRVNSMVIFK